MCGRYEFQSDEDYEEFLKIVVETEERLKVKTGEIFPTNIVPVITSENNQRKVHLFKWGFPSFDKKAIINARAETIAEKPMFRKSFVAKRCLVPANAFYEWKPEDNKKIKCKIGLNDRKLFYMAGIYNTFKDQNGVITNNFVIITTTPNEIMRDIHNRMPVILGDRNSEEFWLDNNLADLSGVQSLMKPCESDLMYVQTV